MNLRALAVLRPRMRRSRAHPFVCGENLLGSNLLPSVGSGLGAMVRQSVRDASGNVRLQPGLPPFELSEGAGRDAGKLSQLWLGQAGQDTQVAEVSLAFWDGNQLRDRHRESFGDSGQGVDTGGGGATFPVVDGCGADISDPSKLSGVEVLPGANSNQSRSVESSQYAAGHARSSERVLMIDHCAETFPMLSQDRTLK